MQKQYDFGFYSDKPPVQPNRRPALRTGALFGLAGMLGVGAIAGLKGKGTLTAITFASSPGAFYVPARALADELAQPVVYDDASDTVKIGETAIPQPKKLLNGTTLVRVTEAQKLGVDVNYDPTTNSAVLKVKENVIQVQPGEKSVVVDKATQRLKAYQGPILVLDTKISTGRPGHRTPSGNYRLGPDKERMHYSRKYDNAPMPYSVQVDGDVFIHGYSSVPNYPASHGCIRMPLNHGNPAKWFYNWVEVGTPTMISGDWRPAKSAHKKHARHRRHRRHR